MPSNAFTRKSGDDGETPPVYLASADDLRETGRAIGISLLGVDPSGPALFLPDAGLPLGESWGRWLDQRFVGRLSDPFVEIFLAAGEMRNRRIVEGDQAIDAQLSDDERQRSLSAAPPFFEGTTAIRKLPQWTRFLARVDEGSTPGHVTSLFALRAAMFHLPLLPALISYLYFEWKSGAWAGGFAGENLTPEVFEAEFPEGVATARHVFEGGSGRNQLQSV